MHISVKKKSITIFLGHNVFIIIYTDEIPKKKHLYVQYLLAKYNLELWTVSLHPAAVQAARVLFFSLHKLKMDIEKLASLLFKEPAIWCAKDPRHHYRNYVATAWRNIASELETTSKLSYLY